MYALSCIFMAKVIVWLMSNLLSGSLQELLTKGLDSFDNLTLDNFVDSYNCRWKCIWLCSILTEMLLFTMLTCCGIEVSISYEIMLKSFFTYSATCPSFLWVGYYIFTIPKFTTSQSEASLTWYGQNFGVIWAWQLPNHTFLSLVNKDK